MQSYGRRPMLTSAALRARRKRRARIATALVILFFIVLIGGAVYLIRAPYLRIGSVTVIGADDQSNEQIANFIRGQMAGDYYFIIPRNQVFDYGRLNLQQRILTAYPALASASVQLTSLSSMVVSVSLRFPAALWCGEILDSPEPCEFLDRTGVAYSSAPFASTTAYIAYYGTLGAPALPGTALRQFLTPQEFPALAAAIQSFVEQAGAGPAETVAVDGQGDASIQFQNGFVIQCTVDDAVHSPTELLQRFSLALASPPFQQNPLKAFEYLDLRFGDSLYYKLKGDVSATGASTTRAQ